MEILHAYRFCSSAGCGVATADVFSYDSSWMPSRPSSLYDRDGLLSKKIMTEASRQVVALRAEDQSSAIKQQKQPCLLSTCADCYFRITRYSSHDDSELSASRVRRSVLRMSPSTHAETMIPDADRNKPVLYSALMSVHHPNLFRRNASDAKKSETLPFNTARKFGLYSCGDERYGLFLELIFRIQS